MCIYSKLENCQGRLRDDNYCKIATFRLSTDNSCHIRHVVRLHVHIAGLSEIRMAGLSEPYNMRIDNTWIENYGMEAVCNGVCQCIHR